MKTLLLCLTLALSFSAHAVTLENAIDAAGTGKIDVLKKYKTEKKDLNTQDSHGINPLMQAVATGQKEAVKYLLQQKVNLELKNENGDTALAMAIGNEQDDIAISLMKAGAKINVLGGEGQNNLVFMATSVNAQKSLEYLVKKAPQQINEKNKKGETPLHEAARYGTDKVLNILLKAGAKKDIKNAEGQTPLDIAKSIKNNEAVKSLSK